MEYHYGKCEECGYYKADCTCCDELDILDGDDCPQCGSLDVAWQGGDTVVNVGKGAPLTHVDWFICEECGHKWSVSEEYE